MHPRFHPDCRLAGHLVPLYRAARVPVGRWCLCSPCLVALSAAAHASLLAVERGVSSLIPWNGISIARRGAKRQDTGSGFREAVQRCRAGAARWRLLSVAADDCRCYAEGAKGT